MVRDPLCQRFQLLLCLLKSRLGPLVRCFLGGVRLLLCVKLLLDFGDILVAVLLFLLKLLDLLALVLVPHLKLAVFFSKNLDHITLLVDLLDVLPVFLLKILIFFLSSIYFVLHALDLVFSFV